MKKYVFKPWKKNFLYSEGQTKQTRYKEKYIVFIIYIFQVKIILKTRSRSESNNPKIHRLQRQIKLDSTIYVC